MNGRQPIEELDEFSADDSAASHRQPSFQFQASSYAKHSTPQAKRNAEALRAFGLMKGGSVLDVGCGNGKTTRDIADEVSPGEVIGLDKSKDMVQKAKSDHSSVPNLSFVEGDIVNFKLYKKFSVATAFFCLQWVPAELLPMAFENILAHLEEEGRLCALIPCYDFTHKTIKGIAFSPKWQPHFKDFVEQQTMFPQAIYSAMLETKGFKDIEITLVESTHEMTDEGFIEYTKQWCGCYRVLKDDALQAEFVKDIMESLKTQTHEENKFILKHQSLRIFAKKPTEQSETKESVSSLSEVPRPGAVI